MPITETHSPETKTIFVPGNVDLEELVNKLVVQLNGGWKLREIRGESETRPHGDISRVIISLVRHDENSS